ncbi:hypothetical protein GCM10023213_48030 [Prosthecobacter algae]|uniref:Prepilin-type N-terminal cleavage/methylation domain-containing protein n=1 Tax=Prosthecobacter algae TaxID=1144682 RepID=A0ABP9PU41_9BACT
MSLFHPAHRAWHRLQRGFSLVEMMACVSIIGIIAFMAIPSITRMRGESERNLAITRAEALNLAQATFIQVKGRTEASLLWSNSTTPAARYLLLKDFISFAEDNLTLYMPADYTIKFDNALTSMKKAELLGPGNVKIEY